MADIARTRQAMDRTLDELGERVRPRHLLDDLLDYFRSQVGGPRAKDAAQKVGGTLLHQIKEHPGPSLLIGAGIAWLFMGEGEERGEGRMRTRRAGMMDSAQERAAVATGSMVSGAHSAKESIVSGAHSAKESLVSGAHSAQESIASGAHSLKEQASHAAEQIGERMHRVREGAGPRAGGGERAASPTAKGPRARAR